MEVVICPALSLGPGIPYGAEQRLYPMSLAQKKQPNLKEQILAACCYK